MVNKIHLFFCFFVFLSFVQAKPSKNSKKVSVEIELESVLYAAKYEIEVKKLSKKQEVLQNFSQKESYFKLKLNVGNYLFRTRLIADDAEIGPWSDWSELLAKPEDVDLVEVSSYTVSVNKNQNNADLDLKWQKANGADKYVVWIEDINNKKTVSNEVAINAVKIPLARGEYKIGIQSISKDNLRSEVKYYDHSFYVAHAKLPQISLEHLDQNTFKWKKQKEANVKIDIYRKAFFADKYTVVETLNEESETWVFPKDLHPGEYKIEFQYVSESFVNGPTREVKFLKKPTEQDFKNKIQ